MNFGEIFKNSFKYHTLNFKKLLILGIFFLIYGILTALGIYWMFSTELFKTKRDVKRKIKQFYLGVENFVIITIKIKCW